MPRTATTRSGKQTIAAQVIEALGSSLDLSLVANQAYPLLRKLIPADYGVLWTASVDAVEGPSWLVKDLPEPFFANYSELAAHDDVRRFAMKRPNLVLRDEDMFSREQIEKNRIYRCARELGAHAEQFMAVVLRIDDGRQGGLSFYRERRHPFSARERAALQRLVPPLSNAMRNCQLFSRTIEANAVLQRQLEIHGASSIVLARSGAELERSASAAVLIERWFAPHERRGGGLPDAIRALVIRASRLSESPAPLTTTLRGPDADLEISCVRLTHDLGAARWVVSLKEQPRNLLVPSAWRALLTARQEQVIAGVLRGWDNRLIATELGCSEGTVKKHLQVIFDKLGAPTRTALMARAAEGRVNGERGAS